MMQRCAGIFPDLGIALRRVILPFRDLHHTRHPDGTCSTEVLRLSNVHRLILHLLGPAYENGYLAFQETAE
jgi:hypothetical protein